MISLLLLIAGMTVLMVAQFEYRSAARERKFAGVQLAAESGIEYAQGMMISTPGRSPYPGGRMPATVNGAIVTVDAPVFVQSNSDGDDIYRLVSTARRGTMWRRIEADVVISPDHSRIRVIGWKESPSRVIHR